MNIKTGDGAIRNEISQIEEIYTKTYDPTGFAFPKTLTENHTKYVDIAFDTENRLFSISPRSPYTSYSFYSKGILFTKTTTETVGIPDFTGTHYFYFDDNGVLKSSLTVPFFENGNVAVSYIYWNAGGNYNFDPANELHGCAMDWASHLAHHEMEGCEYIDGLLLQNYTLIGDGSSNSDAQIGISNGQLDDEDIRYFITHSATPTLFGEQILSPIANIPVYYKLNSTDWAREVENNFPIKQGTLRAQYNKNDGGNWSVEDATDNYFITTWIFGTNYQKPIMAILGQREDSSLEDAKANATIDSLIFGDFPLNEFKPLYKLIYQTNSTYANTPKAKLVWQESLLGITLTQISAIPTSDHNSLTSRTAEDSHPASAIFYNNSTSGYSSINVNDGMDEIITNLESHVEDVANPHSVTKTQVGLSNVDNTSDLNKPISTATQTGLDGKQNLLNYGNMFESISTGTAISLTTSGTYYKWVTPTAGGLLNVTFNNTDKQLVVGITRNYNIRTSVNCLVSKQNTTYTMAIYINNNITTHRSYTRTSNSSNMVTFGLERIIPLNQNDVIDIRFSSSANNDTLTIYNADVSVMGV